MRLGFNRALARSPSPDAKEYTGLMKIYEDGEKGVLNDDVDLFNQFCYWDEVPPEKGTEGKRACSAFFHFAE